jgi:hypothetical protein
MGSAGYEVEVKLQNKVILRDLSETKAAQSIVSVSLAGQQGSGRFFWRDGPAALSSFEHPDLLFGRAFMSVEPRSRSMPSLNHAQQRNLHNACRHMDGLLKDIEVALDTRKTNSVFPKYIHDVCPEEQKTIELLLARFRTQLLAVLANQSIEVEPPRITASHAIHTSLTFIEIAIEELSPKRMGGYGPLSTAGASDLEQIMADLMATAQELHGYVLNNRSRGQLSANSEFNVVQERRSRRRENKAL